MNYAFDLSIGLAEAIDFHTSDLALSFKYLGKEFYQGTRNVLTPKKLYELSSFAKTLPEPFLFGTYQDDDHYQKTLKLMLHSTLETKHRGIFFKRMVLPMLHKKVNLLDVGPGDGELTCWVGNNFQNVTVVDINKEILNSFNTHKRILRNNIFLTKINSNILNVDLPENHYSLILLSHMLYYIRRDKWLQVIELAYQALEPGGIIAIALSGDQFGKSELIQAFGGNNIDINFLAEECIQQYGSENIKIFASKEIILTQDINAMLHIAGFFLYDADITAKKKWLLDYLKMHCFNQHGHYEMSTQQKFILVSK